MPFRANRVRFVTTMAFGWWDLGRSIWFFWVGVVRVLVLLVGWVWGLLRMAWRFVIHALRTMIESPFVVLDWTSRRYFQPGVPWIAFLLILGWSALEGTIFTYTLQPTMMEVLSNITGFDPNPAIVSAAPRATKTSRNHFFGRIMETKRGAHRTTRLSAKFVASVYASRMKISPMWRKCSQLGTSQKNTSSVHE